MHPVRECKDTEDCCRLPQKMMELILNHYGNCKKIIIICDNLAIHTIGSFCRAFEVAAARDIVRCLEFHYTPKHGSWLNIAE